MGGLILGVNTLYMLSCFLKQFALVGKALPTTTTTTLTPTPTTIITTSSHTQQEIENFAWNQGLCYGEMHADND